MNNRTNKALLSVACVTSLVLFSACAKQTSTSEDVVGFKSVEVDFEHVWNDEKAFPFTGGAAIDIDGDGKMEIFVSGGDQQEDALFQLQKGKMVNIIEGIGLSQKTASYGATAIDFDDNGSTDLIIARHDGIWVHLNNDGVFSFQKLNYTPVAETATLAIALADIDLDGDLDLYLSNFIEYGQWVSSVFNDPAHVRHNQLLRNNGDYSFTDITKESGTAGTQNTFLSVFSDLNQDGFQDLVVSNNTGKIEIFENNKDNTFTKNSYDSGLGYWMGVGIGDYDNDGDQDLAISNASTTIPANLLRGDLTDDQVLSPEWVILNNDGQMNFTDVTEKLGLTDQGFGWGMVFEDLNFDGELDLLVAQSYIKWPPHKLLPLSGRSFLQSNNDNARQFVNETGLELKNSHFGQSAIIADLDGDARQDVIWINMAGPVSAALNQYQNDVVTLNVPENAKWQGAKITAIGESGKSYARQVNQAIGMLSDQSPHVSFALANNEKITSIEIVFASGETQMIDNPEVNVLINP